MNFLLNLTYAIYIAVLIVCRVGMGGANKCVTEVSEKKATPGSSNWAVVALTKPGRHDKSLTKRNVQLANKLRPYSGKHNITVLMFSEKTFTAAAVASWQRTFQGVARVQVVNTADRGFKGREKYGYKYMCKFFSIDLYDYLKDKYDYYMRCDSDCYINTLNYDVMDWAEKNKVGYAFAVRKLEAHKPTRETLPQWTASYMQTCGLTSARTPMDVPLSTCINFYNNWHIGRVSFFNRPDVRHYLETVNASGHILSHRWGDSTIQAYAVRVFLDPEELFQVPNFKYVHGSHGDKLVSTFGDGSETRVPQRLPNWKYVPPKK